MPKLPAILAFLVCGCVSPAFGAEQELEWIIESPGGLRYEVGTGKLALTNSVTIRRGTTTLTADRARLERETGDCVAEGRVRIQDGARIWTGARARYNFNTGEITAEDFRAGQPPFFVQGTALAGDRAANVYVLVDGILTTDDSPDPNHHIHADVITFVPGEYVECRNATVYLGSVPVFWWPKYRRSLQRGASRWTLSPGYRNKYGPYLLTSYNWYWNERFDGALHLDERVLRGPGLGPDFNYRLPEFGDGTFKYYYTYDNRPGTDERGQDIDHHRQRVWFEHQGRLTSNATLKAAIRYQSDSRMIRDFFLTEFRDNTQPASHIELEQSWRNWTVNLLAEPRVNRFQETVERLPDLKLTGLRQQVGPTPLFYESESALGYFEREFAYDLTNSFSAARADTFHQVLLPWTFFNWLNVAPRAGGRFTYYGEADGRGATTDAESRWVFNTGAEVSTKLSRTWAGATNRLFQIDGLRHIVQPSVNYVWVPDPSVPLEDLPQFDYEVPTTRLLPITFFDYNSIDSIDSQHVLRFGVEQRLQTRRRGSLDNVAHWSVFTDWRLRPNSRQRTFSDIYSDLDLRPFSWLTLSSEIAFDPNETRWDVLNHSATATPNDVWSVRVGHRYLRDGAFFGDDIPGHNLLYETIYLRFNQNWGARVSHYYNIRDSLFQQQYYTVYRDFRSFTLALTASVQDEVGGRLDYGIGLTISSKAFPREAVGEDVNRPTRLLGY